MVEKQAKCLLFKQAGPALNSRSQGSLPGLRAHDASAPCWNARESARSGPKIFSRDMTLEDESLWTQWHLEKLALLLKTSGRSCHRETSHVANL